MAVLEKDALQFIADQAVDAAGVAKKIEIFSNQDPFGEGRIGYVDKNGELQIKATPPNFRYYSLGSVGEIAGFSEHVKNVLAAAPVLWIADNQVTITLHDSDSEGERWGDRAVVPLEFTDQFKLLQTTPPPKSQKDFVKMLRQQYLMALGELATTLLPALKQITFKNNQAGRANVDRGRESMGLEVEQEVISSLGGIPDFIDLSVSVYKDPLLSLEQTIRCDLDIEVTTQTFTLTPLSGETDKAKRAVQAHLKSLLVNTELPVFIGSP